MNDYYWQYMLLDKLAADLLIMRGTIMWQVQSLHIYPRHFKLIDAFIEDRKPRDYDIGAHDG